MNIEFNVEHHEKIADLLSGARSKIGETKEIQFKGKSLFKDNEKELLVKTEDLFQTKLDLIDTSKLKAKLAINFFEKIKRINDEYISNELDQEMQKIESAQKSLENDIADYANYFKVKLRLRKICGEVEGIGRHTT